MVSRGAGLLGRGRSEAQELEVAADDRERTAQLVAGHRHELVLEPVDLLQLVALPTGHVEGVLELVGQRAPLVDVGGHEVDVEVLALAPRGPPQPDPPHQPVGSRDLHLDVHRAPRAHLARDHVQGARGARLQVGAVQHADEAGHDRAEQADGVRCREVASDAASGVDAERAELVVELPDAAGELRALLGQLDRDPLGPLPRLVATLAQGLHQPLELELGALAGHVDRLEPAPDHESERHDDRGAAEHHEGQAEHPVVPPDPLPGQAQRAQQR